jgi:hypothetical protein
VVRNFDEFAKNCNKRQPNDEEKENVSENAKFFAFFEIKINDFFGHHFKPFLTLLTLTKTDF